MSFLVANIGNTHAEFSLVSDGKLGHVERVSTAELLAGCEVNCVVSHPELTLVVATVVPEVRILWPSDRVRWINGDSELDIDFSSVDTSTLGADRVVNAVAAASLYQLPVAVVDCGTAITLEVVDVTREFIGGAIMPGRGLTRAALQRGTAQLPEIAWTEDLPPFPATNTVDAIRAGTDLGAIGAVERFLADVRRAVDGELTAVAVGGDREFFARHIPQLENGSAEFTLLGLLQIGRMFGLE